MAIVQSSLAEEILSRQERAVIRGIYRASQLAEAKATLEKAMQVLATEGQGITPDSTAPNNAAMIQEYLRQAIHGALNSIRVPALRTPSCIKDESSKQT